ncbi:hypothetical protein VNO78_33022 [Psophocarpus tetragonolobus]|uniref:Uncharacterized protein n=1 Tax=Psophocarpus tetragonolobus TaxID=3891 RepID=A0AAN9RPU6_PSOTE
MEEEIADRDMALKELREAESTLKSNESNITISRRKTVHWTEEEHSIDVQVPPLSQLPMQQRYEALPNHDMISQQNRDIYAPCTNWSTQHGSLFF